MEISKSQMNNKEKLKNTEQNQKKKELCWSSNSRYFNKDSRDYKNSRTNSLQKKKKLILLDIKLSK